MPGTRAGKIETSVGLLVLMLLAGIAAWVYSRQFQFDPTVYAPVLSGEEGRPSGAGGPVHVSWFLEYLPEGMEPFSSAEVFGPDTLSEKIDGKAELYLSAGFQGLICRRFVLSGLPDAWIEVFVYDMGNTRNAFSVFSSQRRTEGEDAGFAPFAYHSKNALFFVHGHEYVEMVASSERLLDPILSMGRNYVAARPVETGRVEEMAFFPKEGLSRESITLLSSDVFGFQDLNHVFTAHYVLDGRGYTLFLSERKDAREASSLAASYVRFLLENGGEERGAASPISGLKAVEILDSYELIFSHGRFFAGVHEAEDLEGALELANRLHETLRGVGP